MAARSYSGVQLSFASDLPESEPRGLSHHNAPPCVSEPPTHSSDSAINYMNDLLHSLWESKQLLIIDLVEVVVIDLAT
jgi:hypothetical protein